MEFEEMGSPIIAFLKERCVEGEQCEVSREDAWQAWQAWCREQGRDYPGVLATFGRNLRAAIPKIRDGTRLLNGKKERTWVGFRLGVAGGADKGMF
jgi:putative DNA primase/helicase